jgi:hypothetical protein
VAFHSSFHTVTVTTTTPRRARGHEPRATTPRPSREHATAPRAHRHRRTDDRRHNIYCHLYLQQGLTSTPKVPRFCCSDSVAPMPPRAPQSRPSVAPGPIHPGNCRHSGILASTFLKRPRFISGACQVSLRPSALPPSKCGRAAPRTCCCCCGLGRGE